MAKEYDCCFEGYRGTKRFTVSHPKRKKDLTVAAPSEEAAMVAAAKHWDTRWQAVEFYAYAKVIPQQRK